jgi:hypothetical protein
MTVRVIASHDFSQWLLKQVAHRNTLADVHISKNIHMYPFRIPQFLPWTLFELCPWLWFGAHCKLFGCPATV